MHQPAFLLGQNCYDGSYQLTHASTTHATHSFISDKAMIKLIKDKKIKYYLWIEHRWNLYSCWLASFSGITHNSRLRIQNLNLYAGGWHSSYVNTQVGCNTEIRVSGWWWIDMSVPGEQEQSKLSQCLKINLVNT